MKLRNPWADTGEWKGRWSDTCKNWAKYPAVKERVGYKAGNDGDFWMGTDDFCKEFQAIYVCLSDKAQAALLEHRRELKHAGGGADTSLVGSGIPAPLLEDMPELLWILHYGQLEKKKGITPGWQDYFCCLEADFLKYYTHEGKGGELAGVPYTHLLPPHSCTIQIQQVCVYPRHRCAERLRHCARLHGTERRSHRARLVSPLH